MSTGGWIAQPASATGIVFLVLLLLIEYAILVCGISTKDWAMPDSDPRGVQAMSFFLLFRMISLVSLARSHFMHVKLKSVLATDASMLGTIMSFPRMLNA